MISCLSDGAVGEGRGPTQALPLHLKPTAFVVGHTFAVHLEVGLHQLPNPLLGLELPVRLTWTQRQSLDGTIEALST